MNKQLKTILLTLITLSLLVIAYIEISGISTTAFLNKSKVKDHNHNSLDMEPTFLPDKSNLPPTSIEFKSLSHDFGKVKEGEKVNHVYEFQNTGSKPLVISNVETTCGCTVPSFTSEPIAPGGFGKINIEFNTKGKLGLNDKNIIVISNADMNRMSLNFKAEVYK